MELLRNKQKNVWSNIIFFFFFLNQPTRNVGANYLGFFEQVDYVEVHGRQLPAWHALQLGDDEQLTDVLQSGHLVHLRTDQEAHGLENAGWRKEGKEERMGNNNTVSFLT